MQRTMVIELLAHRQGTVEGLALEHRAHSRQGLPRMSPQVMATNLNPPGARAVQPGDQVEKGGFAGAINAQQGGETASRDREGDRVQGRLGAKTMTDLVDR